MNLQQNNDLDYLISQLHQYNECNLQPQKQEGGFSWRHAMGKIVLIGSGIYLGNRMFQEVQKKKKGKRYLEDLCSHKRIDCQYSRNINGFKSIVEVKKHIEQSTEKITLNHESVYSGKSGTPKTNQNRYSNDSTTYPILVSHDEKSEKRFAKLEDFTKKSLDSSCDVHGCTVRNEKNGSAGKMTMRNSLSAIYINAEK